MNLILAIPFELRLACLFLLGAVAGGFANLAVYRLAYYARLISPWSAPPDGAPPRSWIDRVPIVGWWPMRRESKWHGRGFWLRPMLLEIAMGAAFAALYWWETEDQGLILQELKDFWKQLGPMFPQFVPARDKLQSILHAEYFSHLVLIWLMVVASMIDVDEKTIPDAITVPGAWIGLLLAVVLPWSHLPHDRITLLPIGLELHELVPLRAVSPIEWPVLLDSAAGLALGVACYWLWCAGLLPRPWRTRRGLRRAFGILVARITRERFSVYVSAMAVVGALAIAAVWLMGGERWRALLTSLIGLAVGGLMIWLVRVIGKATLRKEAMGFGDVTLMAMVGAFVGWQPCTIIFFLAPFAALVVGLIQWIIVRDNLIPYGPFLCLGTLALIVYWSPIWGWAWPIFSLGWFVPVAMLCCMALMGVLLIGVRFVSNFLSGGSE